MNKEEGELYKKYNLIIFFILKGYYYIIYIYVRERARSVDFVDFVDLVYFVYFVYKSYNFYIFYIFYKITMFTLFTLFTKNIKLTLLTLLTKNIKSTLSTLSTFLRMATGWNVKNYPAQKGESVQKRLFWEEKWFFLQRAVIQGITNT